MCLNFTLRRRSNTEIVSVSVHTAFYAVASYHALVHSIVVEYSKALYTSSISEHIRSKISLAAMASFSSPDICYGTAYIIIFLFYSTDTDARNIFWTTLLAIFGGE